MATMISTRCDFSSIEEKWNGTWDNKPYDKQKDNFVIILPPPNVSGILHIGHALNCTYQDITIRYMRMQQTHNVLWIPGTDHGGISTYSVVKKLIENKDNISIKDMGKTKFDSIINNWCIERQTDITKQIKSLGCLCDWNKMYFTMDNTLSKHVRETFVKLYKDDLIYRGKYIVNHCSNCQTTLSNDEVKNIDSVGKLYYVRYKISDSSTNEYITIATSRPETIFADTAIAYNPSDEKYKKLDGVMIEIPIINRKIPLIADNYVKPEFGTGLVKITPAHDKNDYEVGLRHNLVPISIIDNNCKICNTDTIFDGMDRFECREKILNYLDIEKIEDYNTVTNECYKCDTIVEPILSFQWFIRMQPLTTSLDMSDIEFIPNNYNKTLENWYNADIDWCISRQIWWGHQIPIWYCSDCSHIICEYEDPTICTKCNSKNIYQDTDVLDTWFSSSLLGSSLFNNDDQFAISTTLITGEDIVTFWVSRMIIMSKYLTNKSPFEKVYLHGLVRDENGEKMSKSKGNGIDPLQTIKIYGTDALRFTLSYNSLLGQDMRLSEKTLDFGQKFCTKLWNAVRYILNNESMKPTIVKINEDALNCIDKWILHRLDNTIDETNKYHKQYDYGNVTKKLYTFVWDDFCNTYLEFTKKSDCESTQTVMLYVIKRMLALLHPIIPFITEELWSMVSKYYIDEEYQQLLNTTYPTLLNIDFDPKQFDMFRTIVREIRNIKAEYRIKNIIKICITNLSITDIITENKTILQKLCKVELVSYNNEKCINGEYLKYIVDNNFDIKSKCNILKIRIDATMKKKERIESLLQNPKLAEKKKQKNIVLLKEQDDILQLVKIELDTYTALI